eukprot:Cvel_1547.t1-p1 / transcript=Cvel_1547.t1 / gene=Cvel_1547 / organism=Chromera_velia_CCMP2878 / gene_product=hypothetical protein / transcript_product=hypothetical protein / location=Cvel_scaffold54:132802-159956(+) / protein_length=3812 / sequence_SO=supercontig / SO=protein_coding / is_pseudo=false
MSWQPQAEPHPQSQQQTPSLFGGAAGAGAGGNLFGAAGAAPAAATAQTQSGTGAGGTLFGAAGAAPPPATLGGSGGSSRSPPERFPATSASSSDGSWSDVSWSGFCARSYASLRDLLRAFTVSVVEGSLEAPGKAPLRGQAFGSSRGLGPASMEENRQSVTVDLKDVLSDPDTLIRLSDGLGPFLTDGWRNCEGFFQAAQQRERGSSQSLSRALDPVLREASKELKAQAEIGNDRTAEVLVSAFVNERLLTTLSVHLPPATSSSLSSASARPPPPLNFKFNAHVNASRGPSEDTAEFAELLVQEMESLLEVIASLFIISAQVSPPPESPAEASQETERESIEACRTLASRLVSEFKIHHVLWWQMVRVSKVGYEAFQAKRLVLWGQQTRAESPPANQAASAGSAATNDDASLAQRTDPVRRVLRVQKALTQCLLAVYESVNTTPPEDPLQEALPDAQWLEKAFDSFIKSRGFGYLKQALSDDSAWVTESSDEEFAALRQLAVEASSVFALCLVSVLRLGGVQSGALRGLQWDRIRSQHPILRDRVVLARLVADTREPITRMRPQGGEAWHEAENEERRAWVRRVSRTNPPESLVITALSCLVAREAEEARSSVPLGGDAAAAAIAPHSALESDVDTLTRNLESAPFVEALESVLQSEMFQKGALCNRIVITRLLKLLCGESVRNPQILNGSSFTKLTEITASLNRLDPGGSWEFWKFHAPPCLFKYERGHETSMSQMQRLEEEKRTGEGDTLEAEADPDSLVRMFGTGVLLSKLLESFPAQLPSLISLIASVGDLMPPSGEEGENCGLFIERLLPFLNHPLESLTISFEQFGHFDVAGPPSPPAGSSSAYRRQFQRNLTVVQPTTPGAPLLPQTPERGGISDPASENETVLRLKTDYSLLALISIEVGLLPPNMILSSVEDPLHLPPTVAAFASLPSMTLRNGTLGLLKTTERVDFIPERTPEDAASGQLGDWMSQGGGASRSRGFIPGTPRSGLTRHRTVMSDDHQTVVSVPPVLRKVPAVGGGQQQKLVFSLKGEGGWRSLAQERPSQALRGGEDDRPRLLPLLFGLWDNAVCTVRQLLSRLERGVQMPLEDLLPSVDNVSLVQSSIGYFVGLTALFVAVTRFAPFRIKVEELLKGWLNSGERHGERGSFFDIAILPRLLSVLSLSIRLCPYLPSEKRGAVCRLIPSVLENVSRCFVGIPRDVLSLLDGDAGGESGGVVSISSREERETAFWLDKVYDRPELQEFWLPLFLLGCGRFPVRKRGGGVAAGAGLDSAELSELAQAALGKKTRGFGRDWMSLSGLAEGICEVIKVSEKQNGRYPVTAAFLNFFEQLLDAVPASLWGVGWASLGRLALCGFLGQQHDATKGSGVGALVLQEIAGLNECLGLQTFPEIGGGDRGDQLGTLGGGKEGLLDLDAVLEFVLATVWGRAATWRALPECKAAFERHNLLLQCVCIVRQLLAAVHCFSFPKHPGALHTQAAAEPVVASLHAEADVAWTGESWVGGKLPRQVEAVGVGGFTNASLQATAVREKVLRAISASQFPTTLVDALTCSMTVHAAAAQVSTQPQGSAPSWVIALKSPLIRRFRLFHPEYPCVDDGGSGVQHSTNPFAVRFPETLLEVCILALHDLAQIALLERQFKLCGGSNGGSGAGGGGERDMFRDLFLLTRTFSESTEQSRTSPLIVNSLGPEMPLAARMVWLPGSPPVASDAREWRRVNLVVSLYGLAAVQTHKEVNRAAADLLSALAVFWDREERGVPEAALQGAGAPSRGWAGEAAGAMPGIGGRQAGGSASSVMQSRTFLPYLASPLTVVTYECPPMVAALPDLSFLEMFDRSFVAQVIVQPLERLNKSLFALGFPNLQALDDAYRILQLTSVGLSLQPSLFVGRRTIQNSADPGPRTPRITSQGVAGAPAPVSTPVSAARGGRDGGGDTRMLQLHQTVLAAAKLVLRLARHVILSESREEGGSRSKTTGQGVSPKRFTLSSGRVVRACVGVIERALACEEGRHVAPALMSGHFDTLLFARSPAEGPGPTTGQVRDFWTLLKFVATLLVSTVRSDLENLIRLRELMQAPSRNVISSSPLKRARTERGGQGPSPSPSRKNMILHVTATDSIAALVSLIRIVSCVIIREERNRAQQRRKAQRRPGVPRGVSVYVERTSAGDDFFGGSDTSESTGLSRALELLRFLIAEVKVLKELLLDHGGRVKESAVMVPTDAAEVFASDLAAASSELGITPVWFLPSPSVWGETGVENRAFGSEKGAMRGRESWAPFPSSSSASSSVGIVGGLDHHRELQERGRLEGIIPPLDSFLAFRFHQQPLWDAEAICRGVGVLPDVHVHQLSGVSQFDPTPASFPPWAQDGGDASLFLTEVQDLQYVQGLGKQALLVSRVSQSLPGLLERLAAGGGPFLWGPDFLSDNQSCGHAATFALAWAVERGGSSALAEAAEAARRALVAKEKLSLALSLADSQGFLLGAFAELLHICRKSNLVGGMAGDRGGGGLPTTPSTLVGGPGGGILGGGFSEHWGGASWLGEVCAQTLLPAVVGALRSVFRKKAQVLDEYRSVDLGLPFPSFPSFFLQMLASVGREALLSAIPCMEPVDFDSQQREGGRHAALPVGTPSHGMDGRGSAVPPVDVSRTPVARRPPEPLVGEDVRGSQKENPQSNGDALISGPPLPSVLHRVPLCLSRGGAIRLSHPLRGLSSSGGVENNFELPALDPQGSQAQPSGLGGVRGAGEGGGGFKGIGMSRAERNQMEISMGELTLELSNFLFRTLSSLESRIRVRGLPASGALGLFREREWEGPEASAWLGPVLPSSLSLHFPRSASESAPSSTNAPPPTGVTPSTAGGSGWLTSLVQMDGDGGGRGSGRNESDENVMRMVSAVEVFLEAEDLLAPSSLILLLVRAIAALVAHSEKRGRTGGARRPTMHPSEDPERHPAALFGEEGVEGDRLVRERLHTTWVVRLVGAASLALRLSRIVVPGMVPTGSNAGQQERESPHSPGDSVMHDASVAPHADDTPTRSHWAVACTKTVATSLLAGALESLSTFSFSLRASGGGGGSVLSRSSAAGDHTRLLPAELTKVVRESLLPELAQAPEVFGALFPTRFPGPLELRKSLSGAEGSRSGSSDNTVPFFFDALVGSDYDPSLSLLFHARVLNRPGSGGHTGALLSPLRLMREPLRMGDAAEPSRVQSLNAALAALNTLVSIPECAAALAVKDSPLSLCLAICQCPALRLWATRGPGSARDGRRARAEDTYESVAGGDQARARGRGSSGRVRLFVRQGLHTAWCRALLTMGSLLSSVEVKSGGGLYAEAAKGASQLVEFYADRIKFALGQGLQLMQLANLEEAVLVLRLLSLMPSPHLLPRDMAERHVRLLADAGSAGRSLLQSYLSRLPFPSRGMGSSSSGFSGGASGSSAGFSVKPCSVLERAAARLRVEHGRSGAIVPSVFIQRILYLLVDGLNSWLSLLEASDFDPSSAAPLNAGVVAQRQQKGLEGSSWPAGAGVGWGGSAGGDAFGLGGVGVGASGVLDREAAERTQIEMQRSLLDQAASAAASRGLQSVEEAVSRTDESLEIAMQMFLLCEKIGADRNTLLTVAPPNAPSLLCVPLALNGVFLRAPPHLAPTPAAGSAAVSLRHSHVLSSHGAGGRGVLDEDRDQQEGLRGLGGVGGISGLMGEGRQQQLDGGAPRSPSVASGWTATTSPFLGASSACLGGRPPRIGGVRARDDSTSFLIDAAIEIPGGPYTDSSPECTPEAVTAAALRQRVARLVVRACAFAVRNGDRLRGHLDQEYASTLLRRISEVLGKVAGDAGGGGRADLSMY